LFKIQIKIIQKLNNVVSLVKTGHGQQVSIQRSYVI